MTRHLSAFLLLGLFASLLSCRDKPEHQYQQHTVVYNTIPGTDPDLLSMDIYQFPGDSLRPVIFWVHGGGWSIGDKSNNLNTKLNWAWKQGYVFVSVNYRLSKKNNSVKFPDHPNDVADALAFVYNNIHMYGGDSARIGSMGHSAGAHLVALIASDRSFMQQRSLPLNAVKGTVCLDTEGYDVYAKINDDPNFPFYKDAFGSNPQDWIQASPMHHIQNGSGPFAPFFLVTRGNNKRVQMAQDFRNALEQKNTPVTLIDASPYSHGKVNDMAGSPDDSKFTAAMTAFYQGIFN